MYISSADSLFFGGFCFSGGKGYVLYLPLSLGNTHIDANVCKKHIAVGIYLYLVVLGRRATCAKKAFFHLQKKKRFILR